jgi:hypothetical protein
MFQLQLTQATPAPGAAVRLPAALRAGRDGSRAAYHSVSGQRMILLPGEVFD